MSPGLVDRRSSTGFMTAGYRIDMPGLFGGIQTSICMVNASVMHGPRPGHMRMQRSMNIHDKDDAMYN